jgi:hypothetical protein
MRKEVGHAPFGALRVVASSGSSNDQLLMPKFAQVINVRNEDGDR